MLIIGRLIDWEGEAVVGSEFGDSVQLLEALRFLFDVAGERPCVINISLGTNGGPHDGTSLVEQGIDLLVQQQPGRAVVIAASNSFNDGIHAAGTVPADGAVDLSWAVPDEVDTQSELEVWYQGDDRFRAELIGPDGTSLGTVPLGRNGRIRADDGTTLLFVSHRAADPNNGDNVVGIFLDRRVPGGVWTVRLHGERVVDGSFHAWIERNDASQSSFVPPDDNSHTLGSISCGQLAIVVGSYDAHKATKPLSFFSSAGPTRDGRQKPEVSAPGHDVLAAHSRTVTGVTRKSGTSMAAPAVTGVVALCLAEAAARGLALDANSIRRIITETARHQPPAAGAWDDRYGHGRVGAAGALRAVEALAAAPQQTPSVPDDPDDRPLPPMEIEDGDDARSGKIGGPLAAQLTGMADDQKVAAIVKVAEPGYVPEGVKRRAAISEAIFTAELSGRQLAALERDPRVVSVELSKHLDQIE